VIHVTYKKTTDGVKIIATEYAARLVLGVSKSRGEWKIVHFDECIPFKTSSKFEFDLKHQELSDLATKNYEILEKNLPKVAKNTLDRQMVSINTVQSGSVLEAGFGDPDTSNTKPVKEGPEGSKGKVPIS
jgi:hypothetical protein